jgi:phage terminase large subunit-like protein
VSDVDDAPPIVDPPGAAQLEARRVVEIAKGQAEALLTFARADFWCFVELMFPVLYPGQKLVYAPYLELIATLLMRVATRKYRNVIINLPPRHMKSALTSILYTAWRLGCDPTVKFICISYGDDLAHDLSAQTRKIMRSPLYKQIFPQTILDKTAVDHFRTTMGGHRYATAVGSDITGFGADEIIIDDPIQPEEALSERVKQQVRDWVDSSARTRFNDPSTGALVLVMHRLATDDLSGTMEPTADFHLKLPLIAEKLDKFTYLDRTIMYREPGEPLNPGRMSKEECEKLRSRLPARVFKPQYQQQPTDDGSGFCSIDRLSRYDEAPPFEAIIHSWDIALTKDGGDYTVCAKFGLARDRDGEDILYLTGIVRIQVELPDVRQSMVSLDAIEKPAVIILDGNGIGKGVYQDLWRNGFRHLLAGESMTSSASDNLKVQRFSEGLFNLYDGRVRLPNAMPGLDPLLKEIAAFPGGKYDDQVDALSYVAAYRDHVIREARRWGLKLGRLRPPPPPKVQPPPPKSRDQELYDRRRQYRG